MASVTVEEMIERLKCHNPRAILTFSVEDLDSKDDGERWFTDEFEAMFGNGHPELGIGNETEVTIKLLVRSNLFD